MWIKDARFGERMVNPRRAGCGGRGTYGRPGLATSATDPNSSSGFSVDEEVAMNAYNQGWLESETRCIRILYRITLERSVCNRKGSTVSYSLL